MLFCKVCNQGSDREDWKEAAKNKLPVACDHHSEEEVKAAYDVPAMTAGAERLKTIGVESKISILSNHLSKFKK